MSENSQADIAYLMKRTFIAFEIIPSETVNALYETVRKKLQRERITWTDPGNLHITLKFLGDTAEELIIPICEAVSEITIRFQPFPVCLKGLGVFRNIHDPNVLWMGCRIGNSLTELKKELEKILGNFGFRPDDRSFSPHLTLGRIKHIMQINNLSQVLAAYKDKVFQELTVNEIIYYESKLTSSGSVYTPIRKFIIGPAQS